jgi:hypothetical protein
MTFKRSAAYGVAGLAATAAVGAATYAAYVGHEWFRYGHPPPATADEADELLDRFMPTCDVVERHHLHIDAPADVTYAASVGMDLQDSAIVRAIFKARELALGADDEPRTPSGGLVALTTSLGWRVLAEIPGREIVVGAVTQPWMPDPVFRGLPPDEFAAFAEPGHVKIVWNLRADPIVAVQSIARTETRAVATDRKARAAFRRYWTFVSPGVWLIRELGLHLVKKDAEGRGAARVRDFLQCAEYSPRLLQRPRRSQVI